MSEYMNELESVFSINLLAHNYFVNPIEEEEKFQAFDYQKQMMNLIDFGYDIEHKTIDPAEVGLRYPEMIVMVCARQYGKCLTEDAQIHTQNGKKAIKDVKIGDKVLSFDGNSIVLDEVLDILDNGVVPCAKITTYQGHETIASLNHPFLTKHGFVEIDDLLPNMEVTCLEGNHILWSKIKQITYMGELQTYGIETKTHTLVHDNFVTHNTEGVAATVAALCVIWKNAHIGIMSNTDDNAKKFVNRIYFYLMHSQFAGLVKTRKVDRIEMENGCKIYSFGQTENIRGNSLRLLIVDEAAQFDDALLEGAALPTTRMAGAYRLYGTPSVVLISTPRGDCGKFFDYYLKGVHMRKLICKDCQTMFEHRDFPNIRKWIDPNYPWFLPAAPNCPKCGENDYEWINTGRIAVVKVDPYLHPFKSREEIEEELMVAGNTPLARQEILGEIVSEANNVFSRNMLEACALPELHNYIKVEPRINYVLGVDFGKLHDATVFCVGHKDQDGIQMLDYIEVLPGEGGMSYEDIRYRLLKIISLYNPVWAVLDANGIGDPIVEQIDRDIVSLRTRDVKCIYKGQNLSITMNRKVNTRIYSNKKHRLGFVTEMNSKIDLIDGTVNAFARKLVRIPMEHEPGVKKLWEELLNYGYDYTLSKNIKYGTQRGHDDTVIAFAMMLWGLRERPWVAFKSVASGSDSFVL